MVRNYNKIIVPFIQIYKGEKGGRVGDQNRKMPEVIKQK